ncbi:hypothetical protein DsansV1_C07g0069831 [Dioscorea sansibarensis]
MTLVECLSTSNEEIYEVLSAYLLEVSIILTSWYCSYRSSESFEIGNADAAVDDSLLDGTAVWSFLELPLLERLLTLFTYLNVLSVCSQEPAFGEIQEIMTVLELPTNESRSTSVNLLPRNGM